MSAYLEEIYRVHTDTGYMEIGEDGDGLGLLEIRWWESHEQKFTGRIVVPIERFDDVIYALGKIRERLSEK